jgi:hypothetical protein
VKIRKCTSCGEKSSQGAYSKREHVVILDIIISLTQVASRGRGGRQNLRQYKEPSGEPIERLRSYRGKSIFLLRM